MCWAKTTRRRDQGTRNIEVLWFGVASIRVFTLFLISHSTASIARAPSNPANTQRNKTRNCYVCIMLYDCRVANFHVALSVVDFFVDEFTLHSVITGKAKYRSCSWQIILMTSLAIYWRERLVIRYSGIVMVQHHSMVMFLKTNLHKRKSGDIMQHTIKCPVHLTNMKGTMILST